jgi:uncharacterized surface protein with fasciclin (FAS1) repeats
MVVMTKTEGAAMKIKTNLTTIIALSMLLLMQVKLRPAFSAEEDIGGESNLKTTIQHHEGTDIVDTLVLMGDFETLVKTIKAAGLEDMLREEGPYTLFAPTDQAFDKLPDESLKELFEPQNKERLRRILMNHIVRAKLMLADFPKCCEALDGKLLQVHISVDTVYIDDSRLIREDIMCENGIIHAVDTVIGTDL